MKHFVEEIILSFSRQEYREFKYFLASEGEDTERKDLLMLEMIRTGKASDAKNLNADHQTRKRLKKKLEHFALLENLRHDQFSGIHALTETAKYLFRRNLHKQAWEYLQRAERLAIEADEYKLLEYNYDIQISYSHNVATQPPPNFSVPRLLQQWQDNRALADTDSNANAAYALLIYQLREQFSRNLSIDIDQLTETILKQYGLHNSPHEGRLRIYCKTVNLICRTLREKREYTSLKTYAINNYQLIEKKKLKVPEDFVIDLLDAICIATLRSRDYEGCEKYTRLYEQHAKRMLAHQDEFSYYDFIPYIGVADLSLCTNKLDQALASMEAARKKYARYKDSIRISFLLRINLIAVYFANNDFAACIKLYNEVKTLPERKILSEPGFRLELILFSDIYAIIFHLEEQDNDYALYLLDKFKRKYGPLLKQSESKREKLFIRILEQLLSRPGYKKTEKFRTETAQFMIMREFIAGDFEYISMSAWLTSKLNNCSYYSSFLELVS